MEIAAFAAGFILIALASRQMGQGLAKTGLPLISIFLFTGILAGPYVLGLISKPAIEHLRFIDEIALGFIAFAAGAELYLKEIRSRINSILSVTTGLVLSTFGLTSLTLFLVSDFIPFMADMSIKGKVSVSLLAGAILVARSPSSAIAIVNELRAKGPFTQTVLGVTVIMDVAVILLFSANSSVADALLSGLAFNFSVLILLVFEILVSIFMGYALSKVLLFILLFQNSQWIKTIMILISGYLVFILSAGIRKISHEQLPVEILLEPLLICMTAGFFMSNLSQFRKEFLDILYKIGPVIYIAFFTLTGASLALDVLKETWAVTAVLFLVRVLAIFIGTFIGGTVAGNPVKSNMTSWMAYITQAGVGLGLAREVVVEFPTFGTPFFTMIVSIIVLNQLIGPPLFKLAIKLIGEDHQKAEKSGFGSTNRVVIFGDDGQASALALSLASQGWQASIVSSPGREGPQSEMSQISVLQIESFDKENLIEIGCHKADAIVAMLSDNQNHTICEVAYEHFGTHTLIARLNEKENIERFEKLGVLIVDPSTAIVGLLYHFVRSPDAASLFMGMHTQRKIVDITLKNTDMAGLALRDLRLPFDAIIMSVTRRGVLFIPHSFTRLELGDRVTIVGSETSIRELSLRFDVDPKQAVGNLVVRAAARELKQAKPVLPEVRRIISSKHQTAADRFNLLVKESRIMDLKQSMDLNTFFTMVAHTLSDQLKMSSSTIFDLLVKREQEVTTVLAPGLAVPHIIIEGEKKFSILLARCKKGIEFSDAKPRVHAVFVLIGSKDERQFHLRALSFIAQTVMDPRFEKKWMRAKNRQALKDLVLQPEHRRGA